MTSPLPGTIITNLPTAIALDGSEIVPIVQGGTTKRTTTGDIGNTATGFVPTTRTINTPTSGGLTGGGSLASDLTLYWAPANLNPKTAMVVADTFAINDSAIGDPAQITFPNAMKAITGLVELLLPNPLNDYLLINDAATGLSKKINISNLMAATGNVPAGGTIGQPLVKNSSTNYDSSWQTLPVVGGGTGQIAYTLGDILYASASTALSKLAGNITSGIQYLSQTGTGAVSAAPIWATISGGDITGAALTRVDDTNVTLTLGGTPSTALLRAASITAGWSGQLSPIRGGTGVNNGTNTITVGGNLTTSGAFDTTLTVTGATSVTFPTSGTLATLPGTPVTSGSTSISVTAGTKILALTQVAPTATAIALPTVASQNGVPLQIVDWSTSVTDHAITITPDGSEKIMQQATFPIYSNSSQLASITLWPSVALSGWYTAP